MYLRLELSDEHTCILICSCSTVPCLGSQPDLQSLIGVHLREMNKSRSSEILVDKSPFHTEEMVFKFLTVASRGNFYQESEGAKPEIPMRTTHFGGLISRFGQ